MEHNFLSAKSIHLKKKTKKKKKKKKNEGIYIRRRIHISV